WAVLVPAHFMGGRSEPQVPVAVVAPARDLSDDAHVRAGRAIGDAAAASRKRIALVASCDHGHGHDAKGPYGFTPKSKEFDEAVVGLIQKGDGLLFSSLGSTFAREAKADSYWQMLMVAWSAVRRRTRTSIDIALFFGAIAAFIVESRVVTTLGLEQVELVNDVVTILVIAMPYLLLRLVDDFSTVPFIANRLAEAGLLFSAIAFLATVGQPPTSIVLVLVVYFAALATY